MPANRYNRGHVQKNLDRKTWKLSEQGAYDYAVRLFGAAAIESLPKLERGANKGKPKGFLHWRKATAAGYYRECAGPCKAGGLIDAWIGEHFGTLRDDAMRGMWCGRIQSLAGSQCAGNCRSMGTDQDKIRLGGLIMARVDPNRPRCIVCGKPIAKRYQVLWFQKPREAFAAGPFGNRQEAITDGTRINNTFYLANPPRTKEEAQRFSNHTIERIIGMHGDHISGATYWDGESYTNEFFDKDKCAVAQGYASAQHGHRYRWKDA